MNDRFNLNIDEIDNVIDPNGILRKATDNFFPKDGRWFSHCYLQPQELEKDNLPCHLRDNVWLAKMLKKDQKLYFINYNKILKYVESSSYFQYKRHEYEQKIVKRQIIWIVGPVRNVHDTFAYCNPFADIEVRRDLIMILNKIGIAREAIEEGLEKNASIWRDLYMQKAFNYTYDTNCHDKLLEELWMSLRKYKYYQDNKISVDKYGIVEECMLMSPEEVQMKQELLQKLTSIYYDNNNKNESYTKARKRWA